MEKKNKVLKSEPVILFAVPPDKEFIKGEILGFGRKISKTESTLRAIQRLRNEGKHELANQIAERYAKEVGIYDFH